jgi:hypothetical protein
MGYLDIYAAIALGQLGRLAEARELLRAGLPPSGERAWPAPAQRYLLKMITSDELVAAAPKRSNLCEAHYFIGMSELQGGKITGAREHLEISARMEGVNMLEGRMAEAELERMDSR